MTAQEILLCYTYNIVISFVEFASEYVQYRKRRSVQDEANRRKNSSGHRYNHCCCWWTSEYSLLTMKKQLKETQKYSLEARGWLPCASLHQIYISALIGLLNSIVGNNRTSEIAERGPSRALQELFPQSRVASDGLQRTGTSRENDDDVSEDY